MMARWVMSTVNATKCGALAEVAKQGMLCCKFNSAHRIIGLELMFDVMAFMLQLKQAAGSDSFSVIPNTVQTCQRTFDKPMVMTLANPPYTIIQVNQLWEEMTGYKAREVVGKVSCAILQGAPTERQVISDLMEEVRFRRPGMAHVTNVTKSGTVFRHSILVFPLSTDSRVTHYVALSNHVETVSGAGGTPTSAVTTGAEKQQLQVISSPLPGRPNNFVAELKSTVVPTFHSQPETVQSHSDAAGLMAPPAPTQASMLPSSI